MVCRDRGSYLGTGGCTPPRSVFEINRNARRELLVEDNHQIICNLVEQVNCSHMTTDILDLWYSLKKIGAWVRYELSKHHKKQGFSLPFNSSFGSKQHEAITKVSTQSDWWRQVKFSCWRKTVKRVTNFRKYSQAPSQVRYLSQRSNDLRLKGLQRSSEL